MSSAVLSTASFRTALPALLTCKTDLVHQCNYTSILTISTYLHNLKPIVLTYEQVLTRILSFPWKTEEMVSISFTRWSLTETSQTDPLTLKPLVSHSLIHESRSVWLREHVCTSAPNPANCSTIPCLINHTQNIHIHKS